MEHQQKKVGKSSVYWKNAHRGSDAAVGYILRSNVFKYRGHLSTPEFRFNTFGSFMAYYCRRLVSSPRKSQFDADYGPNASLPKTRVFIDATFGMNNKWNSGKIELMLTFYGGWIMKGRKIYQDRPTAPQLSVCLQTAYLRLSYNGWQQITTHSVIFGLSMTKKYWNNIHIIIRCTGIKNIRLGMCKIV